MGRPVEDLATRTERQVDRTGQPHLWLGSISPERGTGRIKVGKVAVTAHRVAQELRTVKLVRLGGSRCASNPACVRVGHFGSNPPNRSIRNECNGRVMGRGRCVSCPRGSGTPGEPGPLGRRETFFRWARRRGITTVYPMADLRVADQHVPLDWTDATGSRGGDAAALDRYRGDARNSAPARAAAVTGVRRGEPVAIRHPAVAWSKSQVTLDSVVTLLREGEGHQDLPQQDLPHRRGNCRHVAAPL